VRNVWGEAVSTGTIGAEQRGVLRVATTHAIRRGGRRRCRLPLAALLRS
jgi:hypothetical protein